jgi:hypothetical protein
MSSNYAIGIIVAKAFADAHECSTPAGLEDEKEMDLHNNQVGRELGRWSRPGAGDGSSCKDRCKDALDKGQLKVLPEDRWGPR